MTTDRHGRHQDTVNQLNRRIERLILLLRGASAVFLISLLFSLAALAYGAMGAAMILGGTLLLALLSIYLLCFLIDRSEDHLEKLTPSGQ